MQSLNKKLLPVLLPLTLISFIFILNGCKKNSDEDDPTYVSGEDFVKAIQGDWYVYQCYMDSLDEHIYHIGDSIVYSGDEGADTSYSVTDTLLCGLHGIEYMQNWTISGTADDLKLEVQDLCGNTDTYTIDCSNYHYMSVTWANGTTTTTSDIMAAMVLDDGSNTINLDRFWYSTLGPSLTFSLIGKNYKASLRLYKK